MKAWDDLVYETAERFGGTMPHPDTAQAIATIYTKAPHAVLKAIDRIALEHQDGSVRSPWGALKHRVSQIQVDTRATTKANDRDQTIERAEQWIRNAGLHYDRATEIEDELFGDRGQLRNHDTPELRSRTLELWHTLKHLGATTEHEQETRLARYAEQRAAVAK